MADPRVLRLRAALAQRDSVYTTGFVLQELLQGFNGPRQQDAIVERFSALPSLTPERADHIEAARLRNHCRRRGVQLGTIDALLGQLAIRYDLILLTSDGDFENAANHAPLKLWTS